MNTPSRRAVTCPAVLLAAFILVATPAAFPARTRSAAPAMSIAVSMERPTSHYYHVVFRAEGLGGETQDLKMPAWTPGYYRIMDYAKFVKDFRAEDGEGRALPFEKTAKNVWRVRTGKAASLVVKYDVYAPTVEKWDYVKYLGFAGLAIDVDPRPVAGPWFGASTQDENGSVVISTVEPDSPASLAGLCARDEILALDGTRVAPRSFSSMIGTRKPGDKVKILYSRRGGVRETELVLGGETEPTFKITPLANLTVPQKAIYEAWLK